jgi:hypothetical protein
MGCPGYFVDVLAYTRLIGVWSGRLRPPRNGGRHYRRSSPLVWLQVAVCAISLLPTAALRTTLEDVAQAKRAVASKNETVETLFNYLTGPDFSNRVEAIMRGFIGMREDLEEEKRVTTRRWAKREKQLDLVSMNTSGMYGDLQGLMGTSLKPIAALDAGESDSAEGLTIAAQGEDP